MICAGEAVVVEGCGDERAGVDASAVLKGDRLTKENEAHRNVGRSETV